MAKRVIPKHYIEEKYRAKNTDKENLIYNLPLQMQINRKIKNRKSKKR